MAKLMCAKCGGKVKMANGGATPKKVLAKAPVNMYGIPQENMGTSGQYGFAKKGGVVKKYKDGGKTGAQLKKEGEMLKAKGLAMKTKGKAMKADGIKKKELGTYIKNNPIRAKLDKAITGEYIPYIPTFKKGGSVKKMQNGGNVASEKPWKNLGIATAAGSLIGALTSEKGIARRADKADARYKKRQTKKLMKVAPKKKP
jgi:hypothetical protein